MRRDPPLALIRRLAAVPRPLGEPDLRIAATAVARGLTLVTGDERRLDRIPGLRVENWFENG